MSGHGRKKQHHEEEEEGGGERWLVTYADMLTLLLVLFIVLYSMSTIDTTKLSQLRASLASALGGGQQSVLDGNSGLGDKSGDSFAAQLQFIPNPGGTGAAPATGAAGVTEPTPVPTPPAGGSTATKTEVNEFEAIEKSIQSALASKGLSGVAKYAIDQRGLVVTIVTDSLVFPGNSATLLSGGQAIMDAVVPPLVNLPNSIEVDGHTNQQNVSTAPYPSGWELSSARASSVVRFLVARNISAGRLTAVGFSDQKPLYAPTDPRSITGNRRVEIVVLSNLSGAEKADLPTVAANAH